MNTLKHGLSKAPVEAMNSKTKFIFRKAYGFRNLNNMIDMIMLGCSNLKLQLSNRPFEDFYLA
ncbi:transposase [Succinivibrio dextrinosolvens]|uniref:transposase n=1 Tax=Succinivibrio dextrinosolvens TaxID=83771 RepID=UPI00241DDF26|nr:transposase [Succinivibrio dextrinosolvens]MBE6422433.1 transposase [Succinivibrio dextrinosolvens]